MARRIMLWAGVPLMVLGGLLGAGGLLGSNSLWQYAVPFWMFVGGLVLALVGASLHERQAAATRTVRHADVLAAGAAGPSSVVEPAPRTTAASSLSSLKRPASAAVLDTPDAIQARLHAVEAENKSLRDYLLAAKVSIAR
jgi:hypothetical protein